MSSTLDTLVSGRPTLNPNMISVGDLLAKPNKPAEKWIVISGSPVMGFTTFSPQTKEVRKFSREETLELCESGAVVRKGHRDLRTVYGKELAPGDIIHNLVDSETYEVESLGAEGELIVTDLVKKAFVTLKPKQYQGFRACWRPEYALEAQHYKDNKLGDGMVQGRSVFHNLSEGERKDFERHLKNLHTLLFRAGPEGRRRGAEYVESGEIEKSYYSWCRKLIVALFNADFLSNEKIFVKDQVSLQYYFDYIGTADFFSKTQYVKPHAVAEILYLAYSLGPMSEHAQCGSLHIDKLTKTMLRCVGLDGSCAFNGYHYHKSDNKPGLQVHWNDSEESLRLNCDTGLLVRESEPETELKQERVISFEITIIDTCTHDQYASIEEELQNLGCTDIFPYPLEHRYTFNGHASMAQLLAGQPWIRVLTYDC